MIAKCEECDADITIPDDAIVGEIVQCKECSAEYEVASISQGQGQAQARRGRRGGLGRVALKITIIFDRIRGEEKWLVHEAKKSGCTTELVDGRMLSFELTDREGEEPLRRRRAPAVHKLLPLALPDQDHGELRRPRDKHLQGLRDLREQAGHSMVLAKAGVPTPKTFVALSSESVDETARTRGLPRCDEAVRRELGQDGRASRRTLRPSTPSSS